MRRLKDWSRSLALRAAFSGPGRSTRQIARRIKSWTGVSERDLRGLSHSEQLYAKLHEAIGNGGVDWAELAAAAGFADQPHMIRQMRRSSGFTPEQLRQRAANDEALWGYRLLGQYFTKPRGQ
jgi:AraC-like DNA-binding protein